MAFTLVTLDNPGGYNKPDGTPANGTLIITLSDTLLNAGEVIEPTPITALIDNGKIVNSSYQPLQLVANNDPGTTPVGSNYKFELTLDSSQFITFRAVISNASPTVDISTLEPIIL